MKFFWQDDKTKQFSDTTLRTWIVFFLFFSACIYYIFVKDELSEQKLTLIQILAYFAIGQGCLYLGKRVNENSGIKFSAKEFEVKSRKR
ncbi:hypothetical protein ACQV5J_07945 [Leptospira interrogans]|uniref:hypothetical protein n=1 Tax=Leptospira interrogans TaxID=173 RepID=UPI00034522C0|nr:hypothetical protein [Leptospira interrogans]OOB99524.1 hypothetical protein B0192_05245 [Leptospira interrogans serovar Australis]